MYKIQVEGKFESAHRLKEYKGKCENLHGHNWKVRVTCGSHDLDEIGIVYDFRKLKDDLKEITSQLDHVYLNDLEILDGINPTSENIAKFIYDAMKQKLAAVQRIKMQEVALWETDGSCALYSEE
jgi:6-pyruvoyltetrahydropterin/6-carboxytetrahydropterin synthase